MCYLFFMNSRIWTHVSIKVPPAMEDAVADFLTTLTGRGVCLRDQDNLGVIDSYLEPEQAEDHLLRIERHLEDLVLMGQLPEGTRYELEDLPEEDWMEIFRSQHTTVHISDRLVIRPTWCDPASEHDIALDPGMAFGTGSHGTTRMCLALLDESVGIRPPERMFDLGTGSGILAIAGAWLGIGDVLAADIDPVAVQVAARNAHDNNAGDRVRVLEGGVETAEGLYGVVTANLSASLLKKLSTAIARHLSPGGHLIISGILEEEKEEVLNAFISCGLTVNKVLNEKVWMAALLRSDS